MGIGAIARLFVHRRFTSLLTLRTPRDAPGDRFGRKIALVRFWWLPIVGWGLVAACGSSDHNQGFGGGDASSSGSGSGGSGSGSGGGSGGSSGGPQDGSLVQGDGTVTTGDGAVAHSCNPTSLDLEGCT